MARLRKGPGHFCGPQGESRGTRRPPDSQGTLRCANSTSPSNPGCRSDRAAFVSTSPPASTRAASSKRRSEEHTSELQSLMRISYAVFCLKKKQKQHTRYQLQHTLNSKRKKT